MMTATLRMAEVGADIVDRSLKESWVGGRVLKEYYYKMLQQLSF